MPRKMRRFASNLPYLMPKSTENMGPISGIRIRLPLKIRAPPMDWAISTAPQVTNDVIIDVTSGPKEAVREGVRREGGDERRGWTTGA